MLEAVDEVIVNVLVENTTDLLSTSPQHVMSELQVLKDCGMSELNGSQACTALHGLGLVVSARRGSSVRTVLFDAGPEAYGVERNGKALGIDFGSVDAMVLSHGHYDHSEGLPTALKFIREQNGGKRVPLHVHPGAFSRRAIRSTTGEFIPIQDVPSVETFTQLGADVIGSHENELLCDSMFYLSGEIPRNSFEDGYRNHFRQGDDGEWEDDPLVLDERFMVVNLRNKGLIIFTGCSHAGIVNIMNEAKARFPDVPLYGIVGGLHLSGINEDRIEQTVESIRDYGPQRLAVGHCTGWRATQSLVSVFGEAIVNPLFVGSRHTMNS